MAQDRLALMMSPPMQRTILTSDVMHMMVQTLKEPSVKRA